MLDTPALAQTLRAVLSRGGIPYRLAYANGLLPILYEAEPQPPLRKYYESAVAQDLCQRAELAAIREAFHRAGLPLIPLKGCLLKSLYPAPHLRTMSDLDLLYREQDQKAAARLLRELGYSTLSLNRYHHDEYVKEPFLHVELHRTLFPAGQNASAAFSDVWQRVTADAEGYYDLPREEHYLFLVAHFAKHMEEAAGAGLRSLLDLYVWYDAYGTAMDRAYLDARLAEMHLTDFEAKYLRMATDVFSVPNPDLTPYAADLDALVHSGTYGTNEELAQRRRAREGGSRTHYILRRLFPPYERMCTLYPRLSRRKLLLPFYYLGRILAAPFRHRAGLKAEMAMLKSEKSEKKKKKKQTNRPAEKK